MDLKVYIKNYFRYKSPNQKSIKRAKKVKKRKKQYSKKLKVKKR